MTITRSAFQTTRTHSFLVSMLGEGWIVTEIVDGRVKVPALHEPIVRSRSKKNLSPAERDKESESRVAAAEFIWYPTRFVCFPVNLMIPSSRRLPKEVSPPTLVERMCDEFLS